MARRELNIKRALAKIKELPTLPDVVFKVNEIVHNKNTSSNDLENVISRDQSIAAKVLKLVNSAFYGLPGKVDTLSRAIPLLGFSTVRNLVMSISIIDLAATGGFDMKQFWRHSFATSIASRAIAVADRLPDAETQSLAGLLHDIGKILLLQDFSAEYREVLEVMSKKGLNFIQAEKSLFDVNHCIFGWAIADKWGFPENLRAVIAYHHNPESAGNLVDFVAVTASANILAQPTDDGFFVKCGYEKCAEACESFHFLTMTAYTRVIDDLQKQMVFFENFLDRMEVFRRPSPILLEDAEKKKGDKGIWKLPVK